MQQSNKRADEKKKEVDLAQSGASDLKITIDSLREQLTEQKKKMDAHQAEGEKISSLKAQLAKTQEQVRAQTQKSETQQAEAEGNSSLKSQLADIKQQLSAEKEKSAAQEAQLMESSSLKTELAEVKKQLSTERQSQHQQLSWIWSEAYTLPQPSLTSAHQPPTDELKSRLAEVVSMPHSKSSTWLALMYALLAIPI